MFFQGRKIDENGKLKLTGWDEQQYKIFMDSHRIGTWFNLKVTKAKKPKTIEQLGYHYAVVVPTVNLELISQGHTMVIGKMIVPIDKKQTDEVLKYFCARLDENDNVVLHDPENHPDRPIMNKRDMGKEQLSQFIENEILWANHTLGCNIPRPVNSRER